MLEYGRLESESDFEAFGKIAQQTFNFREDRWIAWQQRVPIEHHRVVRSQRKIVGGLAFYPTEQWFGGRPIAMAGIALVCVNPTFRGSGVASHLMRSTLAELHEEAFGLSTLYASTQTFYRQLGFEQGGTHTIVRHPLSAARPTQTATTEDVTLHEVRPLDPAAFAELAKARAIATDGNLTRNHGLWLRLFDTHNKPGPARGYLVVDAEQNTVGYVIYVQDTNPHGEQQIVIRDLVAETPSALNAVWQFMRGHRSTVPAVVVPGPLANPLLMLPSEYAPVVTTHRHWMTRIVDVAAAFAQRGYRTHSRLTVELNLVDASISQNSGPWRLTVEQGVGIAERTGNGGIQIGSSGLAALFTGLYNAETLKAVGLLDGPPEAVRNATEVFQGSVPWMADQF